MQQQQDEHEHEHEQRQWHQYYAQLHHRQQQYQQYQQLQETSPATTDRKPPPAPAEKAVRISDAAPLVRTRPAGHATITDRELQEAWWSATDFAAAKDDLKRKCRDHRKNRRYSDCLTQAYRSACDLADSTDASGVDNSVQTDSAGSAQREGAAAASAADSGNENGGEAYGPRQQQLHQQLNQRQQQQLISEEDELELIAMRRILGVAEDGEEEGRPAKAGEARTVGGGAQPDVEQYLPPPPPPSPEAVGTVEDPSSRAPGLGGDVPDQGLVRWLEDEGPRGLEGYSSRLHAIRRQRHLQETKHAVFLEQARQNIRNERDDELLAQHAEMASRRARTFAALMGKADAWAAQHDSDDGENADGSTPVPLPPPSSLSACFLVDDFPEIPDRFEEYPALEVPTSRTAELRRKLSRVLLRRPRVSNVYKPSDRGKNNEDGHSDRDDGPPGREIVDDTNTRVIVLADGKALQDASVQQLLAETDPISGANPIRSTFWTLRITYDDLTVDDSLRQILPLSGNDEIPTAYESVGTLAHVNLRSELLPYKYWIGKVLLDKNRPSIRTVVNKIGAIDTEYRTFGMEVIAGYSGEGWSNVTVKEEGSIFDLDFTKVYWNSRLAGEHRRLVSIIRKDQLKKKRRVVVADLMAGIGPFAVPLTRPQHNKKRKREPQIDDDGDTAFVVYANDLNPDSYNYLVQNSEKNKCENLFCFNMDARAFVREVLMGTRVETGKGVDGGVEKPLVVDHVIMNLPATAPEFLDAFRGYGRHLDDGTCGVAMPEIHVHCFAPKESEKDGYPDAVERCEKALGCSLSKDDYASARTVRNVSPNKNMVCVSFRLPEAVRDVPPIEILQTTNAAGARSYS